MSTVTKLQNWVGGEWVDAAGGETMEVLNPATGEVIAEVPRASAEDVSRSARCRARRRDGSRRRTSWARRSRPAKRTARRW